MANPLAPNCQAYSTDANGLVTGVKLGITPVAGATYEAVKVELIPESAAQGQTVAKCSVLDKDGLPTAIPVRMAWPGAGPTFAESGLPGNLNNEHFISNGYDPRTSIGPLALYVGPHNAAQSDIVYGFGLPDKHHVSWIVVFKEKGAIVPPPIDPPPTTGKTLTRWGAHWIPGNVRQGDLDYMQAMKPGAIKVVSLDPERYRQALARLDPNGVIVARDHPLSEQKAEMAADPTGTGKRHAAAWRDKFAPGGALASIPKERIVCCGINEPPVHNLAEELTLRQYTVAFLTDLATYGLRGLALNLSVGWPRNSDTTTVKNTRPLWDTFKPLEPLILAGRHFLGLHEYWRNDPDESWYMAPDGSKWGWNAHRHWACTLAVPIIIGECGLTKEVAGTPAPGQAVGWIGNVSPSVYAEQLWRYADKCHPNVFAVMPFTTNYESGEWATDDTLPAHNEILARKHGHQWPAVWPVPVGVPVTPPPAGNPKLIIYPKYTGKVTGFYGQLYTNAAGAKYAHEGLDISKTTGTPVYAPADGVVAWSDSDTATYGHYIRTYHPTLGVCFFFGHLAERLVQTGNSIKQGQLLGYTGNTGNSTGPHLHFEARWMTAAGGYMPNVSAHGNSRVDPLGWLAGWLAAGNKVEER